MRQYRTDWPGDFDDGYPPVPDISPGACVNRIEQPGFGVEIGWNFPDELFKPFVAIRLWRRVINIGWLAG